MKIVPSAVVVAVMLSFARPLMTASAASDSSDRPNILIVLTDDPGYGNLGCYGGSELKTSRIDACAAESLRLADC